MLEGVEGYRGVKNHAKFRIEPNNKIVNHLKNILRSSYFHSWFKDFKQGSTIYSYLQS